MNIAPARGSRIVLAAIPFFLILMVYIIGSAERRAANPDDKLLPPISEMADTTKRLATVPDRRSGDYVLWTDTAASLQRLLLGLGISTLIGLGFGLTVGLLPIAGASFGTIVAVIYADDSDRMEFGSTSPQALIKFAELLLMYSLLVFVRISSEPQSEQVRQRA